MLPILLSLDPKDKCALSLASRNLLNSFKSLFARKMWYRDGSGNHIRKMTLDWHSFCEVSVQQRKLLSELQLVDLTRSIDEDSFVGMDSLISLKLDVARRAISRKSITLPCNLLVLRVAFQVLFEDFLWPQSLTHVEITRWSPFLVYLRLGTFSLNKHENIKVLLFASGCNVGTLQLPVNLVQLRLPTLKYPIGKFPDSLQVLDFGAYDFIVDKLPLCLREWDMGSKWNHVLPKLPDTLEKLTLSPIFSHSLSLLPPNLKLLQFRNWAAFKEWENMFSNHPLRNLASYIGS